MAYTSLHTKRQGGNVYEGDIRTGIRTRTPDLSKIERREQTRTEAARRPLGDVVHGPHLAQARSRAAVGVAFTLTLHERARRGRPGVSRQAAARGICWAQLGIGFPQPGPRARASGSTGAALWGM